MTRRTDKCETRALVSPQVRRGQLPAFTPVPRKCNRHDGWTPRRQEQFIEALADTGSVNAAARAVNMSQEGTYYLRRQAGADSFRAAWEAALSLGVQKIEDVAMDRALNGVEVPVYSYGKLVGSRKIYNDRLMMFMLRNRAPDRFTDGRLGAGAKGLNAVGKMELAREKKKWRKELRAELREEWEREEGIESEAEVLNSIDQMIDRMRAQAAEHEQAKLSAMSPRTHAAYKEAERLRDEDTAQGYDCRTDPDHPLYPAPSGASEEEADPMQLPPPGWGEKPAEKPEEEENPRWRGAKDDGWE